MGRYIRYQEEGTMNLRRIAILFKKDLFQGQRSFILIWGIAMPVLLSFIMAVVFGTLTSEKPALGIVNAGGEGALAARFESDASFDYRAFETESSLITAVGDGVVDMGIVLETGLENAIKAGEQVSLSVFTWGESQAKDRVIISSAISGIIRETSGQELPVEIDVVLLGDETETPWSVRVLPMLMLIAIFLGGVFIPSTSVITEKSKRTLTALIVTPASTMEVFAAKGLLGFLLSLSVGVIVLLLNNALGVNPWLLICVLALGALMAVSFGMILGALLKDVSTLFAIWKSAAILLVGPAFIYMFPDIPQWIGRIFPTYYILEPMMNITQNGAGWSEIAVNTGILIGLDALLLIIFSFVLKRSNQFAL